MAKRPFRIPLPHAGVNADAALTGLDANEAPYLTNAVINEPGHIRTRRPYRVSRNFASLVTNWPSDVPVASMSLGDVMLTTWQPRADYAATDHFATRRSSADPVTNTVPNAYGVLDDRSASVAKITDLEFTRYLAFGNTAPYDGRVYGVSYSGMATGGAPDWASSAMIAGGPGPRLVCWGGSATQTTDVSTQVTLNNGSDTGTFTASIPAASMVGMLIADRPAADQPPHTNRLPSFGFSYVYRIIAHVGGAASFTIDRPFGLGATVAQVPNLTAANIVLGPMSTVPMSPPHIAHTTMHRDRIFVAQLFSTARATGVPYGTSVNSIAWSDAGEPSKWRSSNLIQVDDRSDEAITGMVSVANGQMMLIFKPTRTLALVGDSEDNFEIRNLSNSYGCVDSRGIVSLEGGAVFPSERGIIEFDGVRFREITTTRPGHGVRSAYLEALNGKTGRLPTAPRRRRVSIAHTSDDYLVVAVQDNDTIGAVGDKATGARPMMVHHRPTRTWTYLLGPIPGNLEITGRRAAVFEHFTTYADQPGAVYALRGDGGLYRVDTLYAPTPDLTSGSLMDLNTLDLSTDESITNAAGSITTAIIDSHWATPIFVPFDGDHLQITDAVLEYLRYDDAGAGAVDLEQSVLNGRGVEVWIRPDTRLAGNRSGFEVSGSGYDHVATFALPHYLTPGRHGSTPGVFPWRDQRRLTEKLVNDVAGPGQLTLPISCTSFQLGVRMDNFTDGPSNTPGTRIYGLRLMLEGPTIAPGYDK